MKAEFALVRVKKIRILRDKCLLISDSIGQIEKCNNIHIVRRLIQEQFFVFHETTVKPLEAVCYADACKFVTVSQQPTQNDNALR